MLQTSKIQTSHVLQFYLERLAIISFVLGMFFWTKNLFMAFWLRRFFVGLAGMLAFICLFIFHRSTLIAFVRQKRIIVLLATTLVILLLRSPISWALYGSPVVHPSIMTLLSGVFLALLLTRWNRQNIYRNSYHLIVFWAICNFVYWLFDTSARSRLGFLDSQVIFAACLFAIGILLGLWHYQHNLLPRRYLLFTLPFLSLCLVLTQTRSAIVSLFLVVTLLFWRQLWRHKFKIIFAVSIAVLPALLMSNYFNRLHDYPYLVKSFTYRAHIVQASLSSAPGDIVLGGGIGSIDRNIYTNSKYYPDLAVDSKDGIRFESSHNYVVDLLVERGLLITMIFLGILVSALRRRHANDSDDQLTRGVLAYMACYLFVNNINIQMEIVIWICIIFLCTDLRANFAGQTKHKSLDT